MGRRGHRHERVTSNCVWCARGQSMHATQTIKYAVCKHPGQTRIRYAWPHDQTQQRTTIRRCCGAHVSHTVGQHQSAKRSVKRSANDPQTDTSLHNDGTLRLPHPTACCARTPCTAAPLAPHPAVLQRQHPISAHPLALLRLPSQPPASCCTCCGSRAHGCACSRLGSLRLPPRGRVVPPGHVAGHAKLGVHLE